MSLVLRVPDTLEYSQERHAKKNAPFMRSAMVQANGDVCLKRWARSIGVTAFWAFSRGSKCLNDFWIMEIWRLIFPPMESLGSGWLWSEKDVARLEMAFWTVPATSGSMY